MQFHYTRHIRTRMRQRGILAEWIEETVREPEHRQADYGSKHLSRKLVHDKILEVVSREAGGRIILITAYWLEGRKP